MENKFFCKDFYFSSLLLAKGYSLISFSKTNGITTFCFAADENLADLANEYYGLRLTVEPISYSNALKLLKSIIHSNKTNVNAKGFNNNGTLKQ